ncbi:hypothetical protein LSH36_87g01002, partial [Paralvinella palmiformis]
AAVFTHNHVCPPGRRVNRHQPPGPLTMGGHKRKLDVKGHGTPATSHVTSNGSNGIQYGQASWRKKYSFQEYSLSSRWPGGEWDSRREWRSRMALYPIKMEYGVLATSILAFVLYLNTLPASFAYDD